ncbi:MAG: hypothetical protein ACJ8BW_01940 [Ktedonobacteraceae bacterium]|jgi:hypothetical protein
MDKRDKALIHYVAIMLIHNDARRMASTLRNQFTPEERQEIKELTALYKHHAVSSP